MKAIYEIIKKPLFTEKAMFLKENANKILLEVNPNANKHEIKKAMEEIFKVKVQGVSTINIRGKIKRYGKYSGRASDKKKAIIKLKAGEKLDFIEGT